MKKNEFMGLLNAAIGIKLMNPSLLQDVGQAVLESYSRVLEGLAFNIMAWIEDVLFVDRTVRNQEN